MNLIFIKMEKQEQKMIVVSSHITKRKEAITKIKEGKELSTTLFNNIIEVEKEALLKQYLGIYEKTITVIETLEAEKKKIASGKKTYEKGPKGEFIEKQTFDEQAVQRDKKIKEQLSKLYSKLDEAMLVGTFTSWQELNKLLK